MTDYFPLSAETVPDYLRVIPKIVSILGDDAAKWQVREVGDGNLNLVFIVKSPTGAVAVKQALPYVRLVGESWPLPLSRSFFEHEALAEEARHVPALVPAIYHHDKEMALIVMECLSPHIILRKGLIKGVVYPKMAAHIGEFLAETLYKTSDLHMKPEEKKKLMAVFAANTAMCKITEDLVFDEPYFDASMNRHTEGLGDIAAAFRHDEALKAAAQELKLKFLSSAEALIHGDLHTGSIMVTERDTRVIDPEFAFFGPMGFDIGAVIGNLLLSYFSQEGHGGSAEYKSWLLMQIVGVWSEFSHRFRALWKSRDEQNPGGALYEPRIGANTDMAVEAYLFRLWQDSVGFAALKMIRRILGLAHVEDLESIADTATRAACERKALVLAREMAVNTHKFNSPADIAQSA